MSFATNQELLRAQTVKLELRSAVIVSAIIWLGNLGLSIISSLGAKSSHAFEFQLSRVLIGLAGFATCLALHFMMPRRPLNEFWKSLGKTMLLCVPASAAITIYAYYQFSWLAGLPDPTKGLTYWLAFSFAYYFWIFVSWAALYTGLLAMQGMSERNRRAAEMEAKAHEAQLLALRYQLNPHFFFNVLNTLSGLMSRKRLQEAESVIINMADFLRYSLEGSAADLVALEQEITAQKNYLEIEKIRFGDRLSINIDIPADCSNAAVPTLILQPLVENAVKHGVGRSESTVPIMIAARREGLVLHCTVENGPITDFSASAAGLGLGLANVEQRLEAIYGEDATLEYGWTRKGAWKSELRLPFRRLES